MQWTQRKAFTGLVALTMAAVTPALAQDTTAAGRTPQPGQGADTLTMPGQGGAADTAGYSGMERNAPTGGVETGAAPTDTSSKAAPREPAPPSAGPAVESKDPNGFRWTEPGDFAKGGQTPPPGAAVKPTKDTLTLPGQGGAADTAGYSGMERDTSKAKHKEHKPGTSDSTKP